MTKFLKISSSLLLSVLLVSTVFVFPTSALSGGEFKAERIMDDSVFFRNGDLTVDQIQSFLNSKVPVCDTNHAFSGRPNDSGPPYTCLKDFRQDTIAKPAEASLCSALGAKTNQTAAQIIYDASQTCGVSVRVLLVLLQKEQSLITDNWPWTIQYVKATGYGCPDSLLDISVDANQNGCYDVYEGFFNQVYNAARVYKYYAKINGPNYRVGYTNYIQWHPNAGCGGSNVFIQSQATAGLYNYTPYRPNAVALSNLYGDQTDGCSSYGNRNFWRMYTDWFGSTQTNIPYAWSVLSQEAYSNISRTLPYTNVITSQPGGKIYMRIKARNVGLQTWSNSSLRLATSNPQDRLSAFQDSGWLSTNRVVALQESTVNPGETGTFEFVLSAPSQASSYNEYFNLVADGLSWLYDIGLYYDINVVVPTNPISAVDSTLTSGEEITVSSFIMSPDTQSVLRLQPDGNLVLYSNFSNPVWNSGTSTITAGRLIMQADGNLVLYKNDGTPAWHSNTYGNPGARLEMQTDGNMVVYTSGNTPVWASNTSHNPNHLSYVNTELYPATLLPYQSIETANRKYRLVLQPDSNLVLYSNGSPVWASGTSGRNVSRLALQPDGNLVLYDKSGSVVWHTNTFRSGASKLVIQPDGNLVLYNTVQSTWNSATAGR